MSHWRVIAALSALLVVPHLAVSQTVDPRTPAGQLAACGGAAAWQAIGYLEFEVAIRTSAGVQGPWLYQWGRREGLLRMQGPGPGGSGYDVVIDIASRSGGAWVGGAQLAGGRLSAAINWAMQRFSEDTLWLTFPLEWGAPRVETKQQPDVTEGGATYPGVLVKSQLGSWNVTLDPATGRVHRTVVERQGMPTLTVTWSDWRQAAGVFFAHGRTIAETGETVEVTVKRAQAQIPPDVF